MTGTTTLRRSQLVVPGSNAEVLNNAAESGADAVIIDLEDSVAGTEKTAARETVIDAISDNHWGRKLVSVRINSVNTRWWYDDVIDVVSGAGKPLDTIVLPKTDTAQMVISLETLLTQVERNAGISAGGIGIEAQIESAQGMNNVVSIAQSSDRLETLLFGSGDYSASIGVGGLTTGHTETYPGHYWHYALSRIIHAAKGADLQVIDGLFPDLENEGGFEAASEQAKMLGCDGKWVIHPRQIEIANRVFAPSVEEAHLAREIVDTYEQAKKDGQRTATYEGEQIDRATFLMAETIVNRAKRAGVLPPD